MADIDTADLAVLALAGDPPEPDDAALPVVDIGDRLDMGAETMADRITLLSTLSDLAEQGYVEAHTREERPEYRLTTEGREYARTLYERVTDREITVENGDTERIPLSEADQYLLKPAVVRALAQTTEDGVLYLDESVEKEFVDRERELGVLSEQFAAARAGEGRAVLVTGEAGIGKTTVVQESVDGFADALVCTGVVQAGSESPYQVVREALEPELQFSPFDQPRIHPDDPEDLDNRRASLFATVADAVLNLATDRPVVLFLDELHNADTPTLELVSFLARRASEGPVLIVGVSRHEDLPEDHPIRGLATEWDDHETHEHLALASFDREHTRELIEATLGTRRVPSAFVDLVVEQTGGTPLFVSETLARMRETNALAPEYDVFPTDSDEVPRSATVEETIETRLDALDETGERVLELAATLGMEVSIDRLETVCELPPDRVHEYLDVLLSVDVLGPAGEGAVRFQSGLFRETVVDQLPDDRRREFHRRIAAAMAAAEDTDRADYATIATHYEAAGETREALAAWIDAAEAAKDVYAHESALEAYESALGLARELDRDVGVLEILEAIGDAATLLGEQDRALRAFEYVSNEALMDTRRHRALRKIASVHETTGEYDQARETAREALEAVPEGSSEACRLLGLQTSVEIEQGNFDRARELADRQRDLAKELETVEFESQALKHLGRIAKDQGEFDRAREYLEEALTLAEELEDRKREAFVRKEFGVVLFRLEAIGEARESFEGSLELARELGIRELEADALGNLGVVAYFEGNYEAARDHLLEVLGIKSDIGDRDGLATTHTNLGVMASDQGNFDEAREYFRQSLEDCRMLGDRHGEAIALKNLGMVADAQGQYETARDLLEESKSVDADIGNRWGVAGALNALGTLSRLQGNYEEAQEYHERAREIGREIDDERTEAESLTALGQLAERRGNLDRAAGYLTESYDLAAELGRPDDQLISVRCLGAVSRQQGHLDEAADYLEEALAISEERDDPYQTAQVHLERARLALAREDPETATDRVERALQRFDDIDARHYHARSQAVRGRVAAAAGDHSAAREYWRSALDTFEAVGAPQDALATAALLVESYEREGAADEARTWRRRAEEYVADAPAETVEEFRPVLEPPPVDDDDD